MSDPRWRETRPNRPYGGEPGARPRGRVPGPPPTPGRVPGRPPGAVPQNRARRRRPGRPRRRRRPGRAPPPQAARAAPPAQAARAAGSSLRRGGSGGMASPRRRGQPGAPREAGRGAPDPRDPGPRGRGRQAGTAVPPAGAAPAGRTGRVAAGRTGGVPPGAPRLTDRRPGGCPAQPDEPQPARTRQATGPREVRGRRNPRRSPGAGRWGALQGGLGVCIIVASAAVGTIATMVTRSAPGFLLGLFVEAGTVVAALAVRPRPAG